MDLEDNKISIFLTSLCNLHCKHCFLRKTPIDNYHLSWQQIKNSLDFFSPPKYTHIDFTGGEAIMSSYIKQSINYAKSLGFKHISLSTNGTNRAIFDKFTPKNIDKIRFSLDGPDAKTHETIRGHNVFKQCIKNMKKAKFLGFQTESIYTVNSLNIDKLSQTIKLLDDLKIDTLSFNYTSIVGNAVNFKYLAITPQQWIDATKQIDKISSKLKHSKIRYPTRFVNKKDFQNIKANHQCIIPTSSRIFIAPDGYVYRCCLPIGNHKLAWAKVNNKSVSIIRDSQEKQICKKTCLSCPLEKNINQAYPDIIPICLFYKHKTK